MIIGTDQNFDLLKIESHNYILDLLNHALDNSFIPTITKPTRITYHSATRIDNIYIKYTRNRPVLKSAILLSELSDHLPIISALSYQEPTHKIRASTTFNKRNITEAAIQNITKSLDKTKWNFLSNLTINEAYIMNSTIYYKIP